MAEALIKHSEVHLAARFPSLLQGIVSYLPQPKLLQARGGAAPPPAALRPLPFTQMCSHPLKEEMDVRSSDAVVRAVGACRWEVVGPELAEPACASKVRRGERRRRATRASEAGRHPFPTWLPLGLEVKTLVSVLLGFLVGGTNTQKLVTEEFSSVGRERLEAGLIPRTCVTPVSFLCSLHPRDLFLPPR